MKELGKFDIIETIHTSSDNSNIVLKVKSKKNDKIYALKLYKGIHDNLKTLIFNREIGALRKLNYCEGIVKIKDSSTNIEYDGTDGYSAILMDFVFGKTLDKIHWNAYTDLQKLEICYKILKIVDNAHSNDVIHRDLKPQNIIYNEERNEITIIDFGSSKIKSIIDNETTSPMFSENYSAPEVMTGKSTTEKCDYYSIGTIFYEMFTLKKATNSQEMLENINEMIGEKILNNLLCDLLQESPAYRPNSITEILEPLSKILGNLNSNQKVYHINIDDGKLRYLKNIGVIENDITMAIFANSILLDDFFEAYLYYNNSEESYAIIGKSYRIACSVSNETHNINVYKIDKISTDKRNSLIRRSMKINGKIKFVSAGNRDYKNNNDQLMVEYKNFSAGNSFALQKEEEFDKYFGKWQEGLEEAIVSEKDKVAKFTYSKYEIEKNKIILEIDKFINKNIEDIDFNYKFVIESKYENGDPKYVELGIYEDSIIDEDSIKMVFNVEQNRQLSECKKILEQNLVIYEDFYRNISSYKKQLSAIRSLKNEDCLSTNLKDILLNFDSPEDIEKLTDTTFIRKELNSSQKQAVEKTVNSDSISLIQGPPGTGKTQVIKEIIGQILTKDVRMIDSPKILIVSQSHTAVDNILEGLEKTIEDNLQVIRIGLDDNISDEISKKYTLNAHRDSLVAEVKENVEQYIKEKDEILHDVTEQLELDRQEKIREIQKDWLDRAVDKDFLDYHLVRSATVIAGTCIGFLSDSYVKNIEFDYVIIDEAAKATTPELLVSVIRARKIILVGDQNQLPAYADQRVSPIIAKLTKNPEFRLFDKLFDDLPETHKQILSTQYRMIRNIGDLISIVFYDGKLSTGCNDSDKLHGLKDYEGKSIVWFDTSKSENRHQKNTKGGTFINEEEKKIIIDILRKLENNGELQGLDIGIITGYSGQKELIKKSIKSFDFDSKASIDINTLDAFQGRENDIIIYSTVRTKDSIGFQKEKERVNVAFSRAKKLLIIVGDMKFFYNFNDLDNKFIEIVDYINKNDECKIINCGV